MSHPAACYKGIILLATFTVLTHYAFEPVFAGSGGRDEPKQSEYNVLDENNYEHLTPHKRPSFFVGSRYGRSGGSIGLSSSKIRRLSVVPRNDRFFLGSRYGKRAEGNSAAELFSPYEKQTADDNVDDFALQHLGDNKLAYSEHENFSEKQQQQQPQLQSSSMISCVYTGFRNYYRCRNIDEINNIINQLTVAHSIEEGNDEINNIINQLTVAHSIEEGKFIEGSEKKTFTVTAEKIYLLVKRKYKLRYKKMMRAIGENYKRKRLKIKEHLTNK